MCDGSCSQLQGHRARVQADPAFRTALFSEAINDFHTGETDTGKAVLRDYIEATVGFEQLAEQTGRPSKSQMRMFSPAGNPAADNLFAVLSTLHRWLCGRNGFRLFAAMAIFIVFLFGVANFAMHKAVLESGHPLLGRVPWYFHMLGGRFSFAVELFMLAGAMLMIANGSPSWAWGYAVYSALNGISAWLILSRSI